MANGIQVFDASGNLIVDITTRLSRIIDIIDPNLTNGSANFSSVNNSIIAVLANFNGSASPTGTGVIPTITVVGNTVYWDFGGPATIPYRMHCRIYVIGY